MPYQQIDEFEWWKSEKRAAKGLQPYRFRYRSGGNNKVVAQASEWYKTKRKMLQGIACIQYGALTAEIVQVEK